MQGEQTRLKVLLTDPRGHFLCDFIETSPFGPDPYFIEGLTQQNLSLWANSLPLKSPLEIWIAGVTGTDGLLIMPAS